MNMSLVYILLAAVFLCLNFFFVFAEFAVIRAKTVSILVSAKKGNRKAILARKIIRRLDVFLTLTQLGITIASLGLGWVSEPAFSSVFRNFFELVGVTGASTKVFTIGVVFLLVTVAHMVWGELVPRFIAIRNADKNLLRISFALHAFYYVCYPVLIALEWLTNVTLRIMGFDPLAETERAHTEEELRHVMAMSYEKGQMNISKLLIHENIFELGIKTVGEVMVPLNQTVFLDPSSEWGDNLTKILAFKHSRYPLKIEGTDKYVHVKDVLYELGRGASKIDLMSIARKLERVGSNWKLDELLSFFHRSKVHFALVVDGGGVPVGVVGFEDLIEEVVGPIYDEFDPVKELSMHKLFKRGVFVQRSGKQDIRGTVAGIISGLGKDYQGPGSEEVLSIVNGGKDGGVLRLNDAILLVYARVAGLVSPTAAIAICPEGVDFDAGVTAKVIVFLLSAIGDDKLHTGIVEKLSAVMQSDYISERLCKAKSRKKVLDVLKEIDSGIIA